MGKGGSLPIPVPRAAQVSSLPFIGSGVVVCSFLAQQQGKAVFRMARQRLKNVTRDFKPLLCFPGCLWVGAGYPTGSFSKCVDFFFLTYLSLCLYCEKKREFETRKLSSQ